MTVYEQTYLFANGIALAENTTVESSLESDDQDVMTTVLDWAGITPAPITRTVSANNVIPLAGVEFDFEQKKIDREEVEIMLQEGGSGKKCITRGFILTCSRSSGVGQTATFSFTFKGSPGKFEGGILG